MQIHSRSLLPVCFVILFSQWHLGTSRTIIHSTWNGNTDEKKTPDKNQKRKKWRKIYKARSHTWNWRGGARVVDQYFRNEKK